MTSLKTMKTVELEYTLNGDPVGEVLFNNVAYIPKVHTMDTLIERLEGERRTYEGHSMGTHEGISSRIRVDQHNTTLDTAIAIIREVMST